MASQGAPNKAALDYFPKMVNFYEAVSYTHLTLPTNSRV